MPDISPTALSVPTRACLIQPNPLSRFLGPLQYPDAGSHPALNDGHEGPDIGGGTDEWLGTDSLSWTDGKNWSLNHFPGQTGLSESALFVGGPASDNPCEVDAGALPVLDLVLSNGYNNTISIDDKITLECINGFQMISAGTVANIDFDTTSSTLQADSGGSALNNGFHFTGDQGQVLIKAGATLTVQNAFLSDTTADFVISGSLSVDNTAPVTFNGAASILVTINTGAMTLNNTGIVSLRTAGSGNIAVSQNAAFTFNGGGGTTEIDMPVLNLGSATFKGGTLIMNAKNIAAHGYDMEQGKTTLQGGATIQPFPDYYQAAGLLSVPDNAKATIIGITDIEGGTLGFGSATGFGSLEISQGNLTFNAELDARVNGPGGSSDEVSCPDGYIDVGGSSTLKVTVDGTLGPHGTMWTLMQAEANSGSLFNWGSAPIAPLAIPTKQPNAWTFDVIYP